MKLHHVGILCGGSSALTKLAQALGWQLTATLRIEEFQCDCWMYDSGVELVIPYGGSLLRRLQEVGSMHIHHFAIQVDDVRATGKLLEHLGFSLVTAEPVPGVGDIEVNFIHPAQLGIMMEIVQCGKK